MYRLQPVMVADWRASLLYAQQMAAHESARTTKLYDRRNDKVMLDRLLICYPARYACVLGVALTVRSCLVINQ
jgi:hypothetical protein